MIYKTLSLLAFITAFVLDLFAGDPECLVHPVVMIGRMVSALEDPCRRIFKDDEKGRKSAGRLMTVTVLFITLFCSVTPFFILHRIHDRISIILLFLIEAFFGFQALAVKSMITESTGVYNALKEYENHPGSSLTASRKAVGRIVGRDTENLSEEGIIKAAIETVAESFSDGVIAPMLYLSILGIPGAYFCKAVNTMDSMVGYKNERYLDYGRTAAKLDDLINFIPSRLAALLMILSVFPKKDDMKNAYRIWKRDRRKHASPNSAQTESVMAGALHLKLLGGAYYFGEYYDKPFIGDDDRSPVCEDILRANRLFIKASYTGFFFCLLIRFLILLLLTV
ncbi:MAG: adenosylcobinamide-phosphate synthase CbiB [Lachnospiraceae bacterium]|nr:adenosylcobinamide-phosphate synthase CbiB [Lachnospiraceae bacterium]